MFKRSFYQRKHQKEYSSIIGQESILPNFFFFSVKLGHFTINIFFLYVTKTEAYQQKTEKIFVSEEKKFGRIDSRSQSYQTFFFANKEFLPFFVAKLPFALNTEKYY